MSASLYILTLQATARTPDTAVESLRDELTALLADFPQTELVVCPEYHTVDVEGTPAERAAAYEQLAEPLDGPRVTGLKAIARELGIWLIPGTVIERGPNGELFNTAVAISPKGELAASYRKIFPWRPFEPFDPGSEFTVFEIPGKGRVGLAICYDLWFPEVARNLAYLGADLIVYPFQTSTRDREHELVLARATAIQSQVFVLSANAAAPSGTGRSILIDPDGIVRYTAVSENPAVLTDVIDFETVERVRRVGTAGMNRLWNQSRDGDPAVQLPFYRGTMPPLSRD